jgi:hypothetical protein
MSGRANGGILGASMHLAGPAIMKSIPALLLSAGLAAAFLVVAGSVAARTLEVGASQEYKTPSAAAAAAAAGDTVEIEPGEYFDCAIWHADRLTIEGKGPGVVITDKPCEGKALFITRANGITIRNLTLTRARVPDGNGAGIRAEGVDLTVDHVRFINNENGILGTDQPHSTIRITDSEFLRNGKCENFCAHGIYVGQIALLHIERSKFFETKAGHHIKSKALRTELVGDDIEDGANGTASYLVDIPIGGSLVMTDCVLEKGPNNGNHGAAIIIGEEGVAQRTTELVFRNNRFTNDEQHEPAFVRNLTATEAELVGNRFTGKIVPLSGDGTVR